MRWKGNRRKNKRFKVSFLKLTIPALIVLTILSLIFTIRSNIFIIHLIDVQIERADCVNTNQIKSALKLLGQNFFIIDLTRVESELKKRFICIKSVETEKQFPDKIKLTISGREPAAILVVEKEIEASESGLLERFTQSQATESAQVSSSAMFTKSGENLLVDSEGVIYSNSTEGVSTAKIYVSRLNFSLGQRKNEDLIKNALKILEKVKSFGVNIIDTKIYSEELLLINAVPRIIFRLDSKQESQIASLQLILNKAKIDDSSLEFIDLRFDKPVVRFAPKKK